MLIGLNPHATVLLFTLQFRLIKNANFIQSTTPYMHLRLDSQIGLRFSDWLLPVIKQSPLDVNSRINP